MPLHLPMLLTWIRIVLIPLVVGIYFVPSALVSQPLQNSIGSLVFMAAAVTDAFDGYLARKWNQTSAFGAFLDPVADKLMVCAALIVLVSMQRVHPIIALVIIGREITISALREWMAAIGASSSIAVSSIGKFKTIAQMAAIPLLLFSDDLFGLPIQLLGTALISIAAVLTVWSMCYYLAKATPVIRNRS
jgi:CDP-diacylglycerol--glycerol-3-phosphate 3-phosphatidyltransferase